MEQQTEIRISPIFDFRHFLDSGVLTDCTIYFGNQSDPATEQLRAHVLVLANGSEYFYDAFTSKMGEEKSRAIEITRNPMNLLMDVIKYLYNGQLSYDFNQIMSLYEISLFYGIRELQAQLNAHVRELIGFSSEKINKDILFQLTDQCFDNNLNSAITMIPDLILNHLNEFTLEELSDKLDVATFVTIMRKLREKDDNLKYEDFVVKFNTFIGDYECSEEEKLNIASFLDTFPDIQKQFSKVKPVWL